MKKVFTSGFLPMLQLHLYHIGKEKKFVRVFLVILLLLIFSPLCYPQSPAIKQALEEYEKNMYPWKPPEYEQTVSDTILTVLGRWAWGPCHAVDVKGNYAYIGNGPTFHVLDISDPAQPEIVGEFITEGYIYDIEVRDNIAFIAIGRGLLILDVYNPSLPKELSYITISGVAGRLAVEQSFVYVITLTRTMRVVDISDLSNPFYRGILFMNVRMISVEAKDGYVYLGNIDTPVLHIVNATNPDSLTYTAFINGKVNISSYIKDNFLFLGATYFTTHLMIYDITDLSSPQFIGQAEIPDTVFLDGITVSENGLNAYGLALSSSALDPSYKEGIFSIDLTNPNQPVVMDKFERDDINPPAASGIGVSNNKLVAAYYTGALIIDATNSDLLIFRSFFPTGGYAQKIAIKDNYAFVASGQAGLWIFDFANPEKPKAIANVNTDSFTCDVVVEDSFVFIANRPKSSQLVDSSRGIWTINVANIYDPIIVSHYIGIVNYTNTGINNTITKSGNLIFITQAPVANSTDILEIIDVTNPKNPNGLGIFQGNYRAHNSAIQDSLVFLATSNGGLRIIDITEPSNPIEISNILDIATGIVYRNPYVFTSSSTFSVINVDDPFNPYVISSIQTHTGSSNVNLFVSENFAFWAEWVLGIIDIKDPYNPIQIATFTGKDRGRGVSAKNEKIFFADQSQGVWILKNNLVTDVKNDSPDIYAYELLQNYPNPFNAETTIEFTLPKSGNVKIELFDILGRKIATLVNAEIEEGKHKIRFNTNGLSSGIYLYKLTSSEISLIRKMVILK